MGLFHIISEAVCLNALMGHLIFLVLMIFRRALHYISSLCLRGVYMLRPIDVLVRKMCVK